MEWLKSWIPSPKIISLDEEDWFELGHGLTGGKRNTSGVWMPEELKSGWLIWAPPPAIAEVAVEELEESRHKCKHLNHVFVAPRLMTFAWRKKLKKICDLVFELPPGARLCWPVSEHEPLIIGLTLRFSSCSPWQVKRAGGILELEGILRELWKTKDYNERSVLREFCESPRRLEGM
jgi:hypothetical protein